MMKILQSSYGTMQYFYWKKAEKSATMEASWQTRQDQKIGGEL